MAGEQGLLPGEPAADPIGQDAPLDGNPTLVAPAPVEPEPPTFTGNEFVVAGADDDMTSALVVASQDRERVAAAGDVLARVRNRAAGKPPQAQEGAATGEPPPKPSTGVPAAGGSVLGNLWTFTQQIPRALAGGLVEAVQSAIDGGAAVLQTSGFDKAGDFNADLARRTGFPEVAASKEAGKPGLDLPEVPDPDTIAGRGLKGITQFLAGFVPAARALNVAGAASKAGMVGRAAGAGAIADAAAFDGQEERLSNLWQELGLPGNVLTDWLAADKDDPELEGRVKNAIEGLALGMATEGGLFLAAKAVRAWRKTRAEVAPAVDAEVAARLDAEKGLGRDLMVLGDPGAPLVEIKAGPTPEMRSTEKLAVATTATEAPVEDAARGVAGAADGAERTADGNFLGGEAIEAFHATFDEFDEFDFSQLGKLTASNAADTDPESWAMRLARLGVWFADRDLSKEMASPITKKAKLFGQSRDFESLDELAEFIEVNGGAEATRKRLLEEGVSYLKVQDEEFKATSYVALKPDAIRMESPVPARASSEAFINFARIDTPEDVKAVIGELATAMKPEIDDARRGVRTFAEIKLDASHEDAWRVLSERRQGQPLEAGQALAARQLWASSAAKLAESARLATSAPTEGNLFAFRKMMAVHHAIQTEVMAARTETARALASWRIPAGDMKGLEVAAVLREAGGPETTAALAARVAALVNNGMIREAGEVVTRGVGARTMDAVREAWVNGLLSGPKTHVVNFMSNTAVIFQQMTERAVSARISQALGTEGGVQLGEATAQMHGLVSGIKDMLVYSAKLGRMESPFDNPAAGTTGKLEIRPAAISSEALGLAKNNPLGRFVDALGIAVRTPGMALQGSDTFFKTLGYRMELHAQALRRATAEVNAGKVAPDALKARIAELIDTPPPELQLAAVDQALYQTFTGDPGDVVNGIMKVRDAIPGGFFVLPFVRTPANIAYYTFERTPLAPLFNGFRADMAAGGSRRDVALTKMATGTAVMLAVSDIAMSGQITGGGPSDQEKRQALMRTGWQPYSIKIGDRYYAYNRADPLGSTFGLAADMVEVLNNSDFDPNDTKTAQEITLATIGAIANNSMSKTYLSGIADFVEMLADTERHGGSYINRLAGSVVPTGVSEIARQNDPYMREVRSMLDGVRARVPALSDGLPLRRDTWGRPLSYQSGLGTAYDVVSPIYSKQYKPEPIDKAILANGWDISQPNRVLSIPKKVAGARDIVIPQYEDVAIDLDKYPGAYSRYLELAGQVIRLPQYGDATMVQALNELVEGKSQVDGDYSTRSNEGKEVMVKDVIRQYRAAAREQILDEFPGIVGEVTDKARRKGGGPVMEMQ